MNDRHPLVVKLKSGEYDGNDLMQAWLLIESQQRRIAQLEALLKERQENGHGETCAWMKENITEPFICVCGHDDAAAYFKEVTR